MTDPNMPPVDRPTEPVHHTTVNVAPERSGGGGGMGVIIGALVVIVAIIAVVVFLNRAPMAEPGDTNLDVNIDVPTPEMPKMPDVPSLPEMPAPAPAE